MDKSTVLKFLIIGALSYFLVKGILYLALWQALGKIEKNALAAKQRRMENIKQLDKNRDKKEWKKTL